MSDSNVRLPAEWEPQDWLWIGFPHDPDEWDVLAAAQEEVAGFANAVAESGQEVRLLVRDAANEARARSLVSGAVTLERRSYGDIWLRDTGPIVLERAGVRAAVRPGFNGWGGKYLMAGDQTIGEELARDAGLDLNRPDWVLEGGAIDTDGSGTVLTTEQCLLNPNRNPSLTREQIEDRLAEDFGLTRVVWLGDGLLNDHTDGHVDNLARFVAPGTVALAEPFGRRGRSECGDLCRCEGAARRGRAQRRADPLPGPHQPRALCGACQLRQFPDRQLAYHRADLRRAAGCRSGGGHRCAVPGPLGHRPADAQHPGGRGRIPLRQHADAGGGVALC